MSGEVKNKLLLYADDSRISVSGNDMSELESVLSSEKNVLSG